MKKSFIRKIYSDNLINKLETKIKMSGKNMNAMNFQNLRVVTTIIMFFLALYGTNLGYVFGPLAAIIWYFLYDYLFLEISVKKRGEKLNREALDFFEILTLTLESGRNLENSLEIAVLTTQMDSNGVINITDEVLKDCVQEKKAVLIQNYQMNLKKL